MTPEQQKLLKEILYALITACYNEMGREWCDEMVEKIEKLTKP